MELSKQVRNGSKDMKWSDVPGMVFDVLAQFAGAEERQRDEFCHWFADYIEGREFRFMGSLGTGGKFYRGDGQWRVGCYREDMTVEREEAIRKTTYKLNRLKLSL